MPALLPVIAACPLVSVCVFEVACMTLLFLPRQLPPGAVSMFGGAPNPLAAALKARKPPSDDENEVCFFLNF